MNETVDSWGEAVLVSVTQALSNFLGFLPALVGALLGGTTIRPAGERS